MIIFHRIASLKFSNIELSHLQHCLHRAVGLCTVGIAKHLAEYGGNHLPRNAELIGEPSAAVGVRPPSESLFQ